MAVCPVYGSYIHVQDHKYFFEWTTANEYIITTIFRQRDALFITTLKSKLTQEVLARYISLFPDRAIYYHSKAFEVVKNIWKLETEKVNARW